MLVEEKLTFRYSCVTTEVEGGQEDHETEELSQNQVVTYRRNTNKRLKAIEAAENKPEEDAE